MATKMVNKNPAEVPVIDMGKSRSEVVAKIKEAAETWGAFYVINHRIPDTVMDALLDGIRRFHEQPMEAKMKYFADDFMEEKINTKITLDCHIIDGNIASDQIPPIHKKEVEEYANSIIALKETLSELLSEALGLSSDYLSQLEVMKSASLRCHYYPACPKQDNSSGLKVHSDSQIITILHQDDVGGLQALQEGNWIDVPPKQGSLIVNIGDLMQLITNGKFKAMVHRVVNVADKPRVSSACFFFPSSRAMGKAFSPIKELTSDANPPLYKEVTFQEFTACYLSKEVEGLGTLNHPSLRV